MKTINNQERGETVDREKHGKLIITLPSFRQFMVFLVLPEEDRKVRERGLVPLYGSSR